MVCISYSVRAISDEITVGHNKGVQVSNVARRIYNAKLIQVSWENGPTRSMPSILKVKKKLNALKLAYEFIFYLLNLQFLEIFDCPFLNFCEQG